MNDYMDIIELLNDRLAGEEINPYRSWSSEEGILFSSIETKAILDELVKLRYQRDKLKSALNGLYFHAPDPSDLDGIISNDFSNAITNARDTLKNI
jgi:hypothetical protein